MFKYLRNAKLASALGFLILIALIWWLGPWFGLKSLEARLLWICCVMLIWVGSLLVGRFLAERAGGVFEKVLRRQADKAVIDATAEQRRDVAQLRQRLLSAIDTLKSSRLGKTSGKAALYELPWYMVIGHPAAGKSSAITHSGLSFPFGEKQAIPGVGGTRNCDWFFTTEGVLLDTAGRYSTEREDRPEWLEFLKLLKKYRSRAPVNGILVAVSFPELVQHRSEQFSLYARQVRERINEIDDAFGIKVPIYLVFTKIDLLGGFAQFFEDFSEEERQGVWGATLSCDQGNAFDAVRVVGQQFDGLARGLVQMGFDKLANNRSNVNRPALFAFPIEFNAMREAVCKFVELLFQDDPYHSKPLLRGFYFTSALQEGSPRLAAGSRVASVFDLSRWGFDTAQRAASNGFFLRSLFRDVIFPDQHLIAQQVKPTSRRLRLAGLVAGLGLLAILVGGLTWSFVGNQKLIANANEELRVARNLAASGELSDRLKGALVLQLRIEQLYQYRTDAPFLSLGFGLYQGGEVEKTLRREYFATLRELMLQPVKASLESTLGGLGTIRPAVPAVASEPAKPAVRPAPAPAPKAPPAPRRRALPVIPIGYESGEGAAPVVLRSAVYRPGETPPFVRGWPETSAAGYGFRRVAAAAPAPAPAVEAGGNQLEAGYNALKTYLMLNQKERMDVAHLSDQMPRYWRPWLDANRGAASVDDVRRLAERIVAFYVTQLKEDDLPLVETRADLIGESRDKLRGAFHQLSAPERVYNELKARANTQFAAMTIGRMLNGRDSDPLAGSSSVPGAFTREAWEKYFRNAIVEASKGEVRGDDWVLASSMLDNLGKDGNAERSRQELESLYKAEYAREWKKFLAGVAVKDLNSISGAVQALGKLADPQQSALRVFLARAAVETSWDNPSQLSQSIETAKTSVLERTEKLVLGAGVAPPTVPAAQQYGELGRQFAALLTLSAAGEGGRTAFAPYLELLAKLRTRIGGIATNAEPGVAARQLMQATLSGGGSEFAEGLALVDGNLLASASDDTKEFLRPLLVRPLIQSYAALVPAVEEAINESWRTEVLGQWRGLSTKYPFADSSHEASVAEIARFLKPTEGTLARFIDKHLAGLVVMRGEQLLPRTWANVGVHFNPAFLTGAARLSSAASVVLGDGEKARFELQPLPTPGVSEILIEVDGQTLRYRNGPQPWTGFTWPNEPGVNAQGARIQLVNFAGASASVANFSGRLGLIRLLSQARGDEHGGQTAQLEWHVRQAGAAGDGEAVRFNFRLVSGGNPLALSSLSRIGLPEKITN